MTWFDFAHHDNLYELQTIFVSPFDFAQGGLTS